VSDDRAASPEWRAVMRRFWRRVIVVMIIQTVVIVALVKLLPDI
jgi:type IV secretory pathway component VirB8